MKRFTAYGLAALGLLFVAGVAGMFSGARAIAQTAIRAALVKNVDEPGRVPYQERVDGDCKEILCVLIFPPATSGKRLVIEHVAGLVIANTSSTPVAIDLLPGGTSVDLFTTNPPEPFAPLPTFLAANVATTVEVGVNTGVHFYAEAGQRPTLAIQSRAVVSVATFVVTGYLIDKSL